jgi:hypothetical protein
VTKADLPYDNSLSYHRISKSFLPGDMWLQGNPMLQDGNILPDPMLWTGCLDCL